MTRTTNGKVAIIDLGSGIGWKMQERMYSMKACIISDGEYQTETYHHLLNILIDQSRVYGEN